MKTEVHSITFGGIGGQGVLKASEIAGWAAMYDGYHIKKSEVHGMAQRGGSVMSHIRISADSSWSPQIPKGRAHMVIALEPTEAVRVLVTSFEKRADQLYYRSTDIGVSLSGDD